MSQLQRGDAFKSDVIVLKMRNGVPTVISVQGRVYVLNNKY